MGEIVWPYNTFLRIDIAVLAFIHSRFQNVGVSA